MPLKESVEVTCGESLMRCVVRVLFLKEENIGQI